MVEALSAMQATDLESAKWSIGLRLGDGASEADVDRALADGSIIRTHAMRGTWQLIAPDDLRCLLKLLGPPAVAARADVYRRFELDEETFRRGNAAIAEALAPRGSHLTREELGEALERAGVPTAGERLDLLLQRAGLDSLIGSGVARGGEHTFALLDHRVAPLEMPGRATICAVLMERYFRSRSPATVEDYTWWAGLDDAFVQPVFESMKRGLESEVVDGTTYWSDRRAASGPANGAALLPAHDDYLASYRDGDAARPIIVASGRVIGTWRAERAAGSVTIHASWSAAPGDDDREAVAAAARRYGAFFGLSAALAG